MPDPSTVAPDRLVAAIDRVGTPACVGVDPVLERLPAAVRDADPAAAIERFGVGVVEAVAGVVAAVKPQSGCFERFGSAGVRALERVVHRARELGLVVVLDAKRGDIGSTSAHYAAAASGMGADWITVNAYLGMSGIEPFLDAGLGVFALVRTSNPDSDALQAAALASGGTVAGRVAQQIAELGASRVGASGLSAVGAVVGATKAGEELAGLRAVMPDVPCLVPGVGAQGGACADVRPLARAGASSMGAAGVVINASRSVLYPGGDSGNWQEAIASAARAFADEARGVFG
ncbi:MAG: orotidine-5'-phosphate decarboxylase [Phycisphaerales bacterium]